MTMARQVEPRQERVMESQRSMIKRAAREGLSNLVQFALELGDAANEVDTKRLVESQSEDDVPLITACLAGHLDVVRNLVEKCKAPLSSRAVVTIEGDQIEGVPPVWAAAYSGNLELVRYLVEKGAAIEDSTKSKSTPLRVAAFDGHLPIVRYLVEKGADINSVNFAGHSVLMAACYREHMDIIRFLLEKGADVNYTVPQIDGSNVVGENVLHNCARNGNVEIAKLLVEHGAIITHKVEGETALMMAAYRGHHDLVNYLVDTPDCSRDDKADALELLGTYYLRAKPKDTEKCLSLWKRAMEERQKPGKPEARKKEAEKKIAAYRNASEVQTMSELMKLHPQRHLDEIRMQALLVSERVLGPGHDETIFLVRYIAACYADESKYERSVELLLHAMSNLSNAPPHYKEKLDVYCDIVVFFVEMLERDGEKKKVKFGNVMEALEMCIVDIERGEKAQKPSEIKNNAIFSRRHDLLKVALHLISLGIQTQAASSTNEQQQQRLFRAVQNLIRMDLRSKEGATLLHMACTSSTAELTAESNGCTFPSPEVVKALLNAGSGVHVKNDAGQTALEVARAEAEGGDSDVTKILFAAGAC